jgi:hypothetical protein
MAWLGLNNIRIGCVLIRVLCHFRKNVIYYGRSLVFIRCGLPHHLDTVHIPAFVFCSTRPCFVRGLLNIDRDPHALAFILGSFLPDIWEYTGVSHHPVLIRTFISAFICLGILLIPFCCRHLYHPCHSWSHRREVEHFMG